jgi:hypothetical protein
MAAALADAELRIAELEAELFSATSTTTTTAPADLVVWSHETGEYLVDPVVDWVWGWVSNPNATVEVNGSPLVVGDPVGQGLVAMEPPWTAAWDVAAPDDWSLPLTEGRNMLMVTATFPDRSTLVDDIVVFHDPNLTERLGVLTGYNADEPRSMTFGIGTEDRQPAGSSINVESVETYKVAEDAVFKLEAADTLGWRVMGATEWFELLEFIDSGECAPCNLLGGRCPETCIWASWDGSEGLDFAIYLNPDGDIQQLTQLHLHN